MITTPTRKKGWLRGWFSLCPIRHLLIIVFGLFIAAYFLLRSNTPLLEAVSENFVRPWHRAISSFCAYFPFSVAEALIILAVLGALVYIIFQLVFIFRRSKVFHRIYRIIMTLAMAFCVVYGGFCTLWGIYYYTSDFEEQSGIYAQPVSREALETVTRYFTVLLNDYSTQIQRGEDGLFAEDMDAVFDYSPKLYEAVSRSHPCLKGPALAPKPFAFSGALSYMTFTGFFFPFTGEANINIHSPDCMIPSTIAHEIAHQRGVAEEDEANFVAVLACLEDGNPVYCYSACLMAYTHLGNALYKANYEAWLDNYYSIAPEVLEDISFNNSYWNDYNDTAVNSASDAVYTGLLHSYGQTDGLKTYGKCIDLLVAYYYEEAAQFLYGVN